MGVAVEPQHQGEPQGEPLDGDDLLADASGGKGVVRNPIDLGS